MDNLRIEGGVPRQGIRTALLRIIRSLFTAGSIDRHGVWSLATFAAALLVAAAVYAPGLSGPLFLDDLQQLQGMINNSAADPGVLLDRHIISNSGPFGRPVAMASFVGSAISHGPDTWWWKYENVMFHLVTGLLIFWLTALLLSANSKSEQNRHWLVAAAAAAIWLLHPLHVSTVLYTVQRMTELSSLFVFAGLICYVKGRQRQVTGERSGWPLICLGFGVFLPLALLSKESALLFPIFCSLIEFFIFHFAGNPTTQKQIKVFHSALVIGYLLVALYVLANFADLILKNYAIRDFTFSERIFTELRIVVLYLSQLLLPVQSKMGFFHDDIALSTSLFQPITTLLSGVLLVGLLASAAVARKRLPLYAFGILFFFAGHVLESTIFSLELMYEHRNYLPSFGILIAVLAILQAVMKQRRGLIWITVIALSGLSLLTWQRAITWGSPASMYQFMYHAHPQSQRLTLIFADFYTKMEAFDEARKTLAKMNPGLGPELHELFLDCSEHGRVESERLLRLTRIENGQLDGHVAINIDDVAMAVLDGRCSVPKKEFVTLLDHLMTLPSRTIIHKRTILTAQARILESMNEIDAAIAALQTAYELQTNNAISLYFSAHTLSVAGRLHEATAYLTKAYELEKSSVIQHKDIAKTIYMNIGSMFVVQNQLEEALAVYSEGALSIPAEPRFYLQKTKLLIQLGLNEDAERTLMEIRMLDANSILEHEFVIRRMERAL